MAKAPEISGPFSGLKAAALSELQAQSRIWMLLLLIFAAATTYPSFAQAKHVSAGPQASPKHFSGAQAYEYAKEFVAIGPRYIGGTGHDKAEAFLQKHFAPEAMRGNLEKDEFTMSTPIGQLGMRNYIVRYPGKKDGVIVLATHYETNYPLRDIGFVGANDGGSTTGLLMEIGDVLRSQTEGGKLLDGYSVWLVFDDGEEAIQQWSSSDSLYGTRHLAAKWQNDGTLKRIKAFLVADMIGDKDLDIARELNSTPWLEDLVYQAAKDTGNQSHFFKTQTAIEDDHLPFAQRGVPVADIIDYNFGPHDFAHPDGYHHTAEDTMDKISARSLQIDGEVFMETIRLLDQR
ncbi:MAG: M28 family peptidase [Acidobacteriaceae bacterium]